MKLKAVLECRGGGCEVVGLGLGMRYARRRAGWVGYDVRWTIEG